MLKTIHIPANLHKKLKYEALNQDKQLKDLVVEILEAYLKNLDQ